MSAPTADEIAALLALPEAAREALAKVATTTPAGGEGPGWGIGTHRTEGLQWRTYSSPSEWRRCRARAAGQRSAEPAWLTEIDGWAWIPADTAEILAAVARKCLMDVHTETYHEAGRLLSWAWVVTGADAWSCRGDTARLAALRLLAAVYT